MPDIDPAALSRAATGSGDAVTPLISSKTILPPSITKAKASNHVPPRIDLEPLYTALKAAIGENWPTYKEAVSSFMMGHLNQTELALQIEWFLVSNDGSIENLHNQLIAGIYTNITREIPEHGVASWVSANDKPTTATNKQISGDAVEQRLKSEVMQMPSRDRRRLKDVAMNNADPFDVFANMLGDHHRTRASKQQDAVPASAGGLNRPNFDGEIRKRFAQPLAVESGEFPDSSTIESRMLPICYETGLIAGHSKDAPQFMSVATETFIKEFLSSVFSKTRSNGPGVGGSAGSGGGAGWIMSHKYRRQLEKEEEAWHRGELQRDKTGLLPIEAKAASERGPLGMADVRTALEMGDCGLGQMGSVMEQIMFGYREGELQLRNDYSYVPGYEPPKLHDADVQMGGTEVVTNGVSDHHWDDEQLETDDWGWGGGDIESRNALDSLLDSVLAGGS